MSVHVWWLFVAAVFLLSGTPGPNMLHILSRSVTIGVRRSLAAMAGCILALVLVLATSAAGLSTVLMALPGAFDALRVIGAGYLVYLGLKSWFSDTTLPQVDTAAPSRTVSPGKVFAGGFAVCASNPKLILFAAAFLPQFVNPAEPSAPQFAILVATFAAIELFWLSVYALCGKSLSHHLARPNLRRTFNRLTGGIFIGFSALLLNLKAS